MRLKDILGKTIDSVTKNWKKSTAIALLGAATLTTALKDNVHFGSTKIYNPTNNHYVWGLSPTVEVEGKGEGNINNFGLLIPGIETENANLTGDINNYGILLSGNSFKDSAVKGDISAYAIIGSKNRCDGLSLTGDMKSCGVLAGINGISYSSSHDNSLHISHFNGDLSAFGLFWGGHKFLPGSVLTGNISSRGLFADGPEDLSCGAQNIIGLENYIVKEDNSVEARK